MRTLSIISPVYNEEEVINSFYSELKKVLIDISDSFRSEIVFVVDRSEDRTLDILRDISNADPAVKIVALSSHFGHQMQLLAGIDNCDSDAIVMMDSDLQHPPELIPALLKKFEQGYDIVYTLRQDTHKINMFKRISSRVFYRFLNFISEIPMHENAADFRLISRRVAEVFKKQIRERNQFLRGLFNWVGFKSTAIPFTVRERGAGKSKYTLKQMTLLGINGIVSFSKSPLKATIIAGFLFALSGFAFIVFILLKYLFYSSMPSGWATLAILLLIFSGIQLVFLGVLGLYVGAIFDEVKDRPHYIIEERINFDN